MHFERSLKRSIYPPWKDKYIDYPKLKALLRDEGSEAGSVVGEQDADEWTDQDEGAFVEELVNVQLEKVHAFQSETIQQLRDRTAQCEAKLDPVIVVEKDDAKDDGAEQDSHIGSKVADGGHEILNEVLKELDTITKEMNELEKFSRINYTGFLKATKKHDRKRGHAYRVRPMMQVRLAELPFNKEDYSPLLFRLSSMYGFIRQNSQERDHRRSSADSQSASDEYTSYKYWVHPDNLLELKTTILRRLPVLVFNPQTSKIAEGSQGDPTITSIYFDNPTFDLYNAKVDHKSTASSLRLRWYGQLDENPEVYCEKKTVDEDDVSTEQKVTTKVKHVQGFLEGDYKLEKDIQKLRDRYGDASEQVASLQSTVECIQELIKSSQLQPMLRANYTRTAFQIPGDSRVRITLDTNLALIREDSLDPTRPCRDPKNWHRREIDAAQMEFPFTHVNHGEINHFPYALLEIRLRGKKKYEWTSDLMNSHLVKPAPRFSKFVHGVAQLFDDYVNTFPFWLNEVDSDIRKDPHQAFEEEQALKQAAADEEFAVGSLLKTSYGSPLQRHQAAQKSPIGSPEIHPKQKRTKPTRASSKMTKASAQSKEGKSSEAAADSQDNVEVRDSRGLLSLLPSMSKYAQSRRRGQVQLPPGVQEPSFWIKDEGPVKVEAKVWLANQRTFIKWQHVGILLSSLSLGLFNAAGAENNIARALGAVYTAIGILTAIWGYSIYMWRSDLIRARSGKDFDNILGPIVVCLSLVVALILNLVLKVCHEYETLARATYSSLYLFFISRPVAKVLKPGSARKICATLDAIIPCWRTTILQKKRPGQWQLPFLVNKTVHELMMMLVLGTGHEMGRWIYILHWHLNTSTQLVCMEGMNGSQIGSRFISEPRASDLQALPRPQPHTPQDQEHAPLSYSRAVRLYVQTKSEDDALREEAMDYNEGLDNFTVRRMAESHISLSVSKHNSTESCWVILYDQVYDVTNFLPNHPGGSKVVLQLAGQDATTAYDPVHPPGTLEDSLPLSAHQGSIDRSTLPRDETVQSSATSKETPNESTEPPDLSTLLSLDDIEATATRRISHKAWSYYYSAADDLHTKIANSTAYASILLRPRIFLDVTSCSLATTILSHPVQLPIFVSPAAMARLAHPSGEAGIALACRKSGACQIVSNNASMTPEDIVAEADQDQIFGWQLYVQTDRKKSERMLQRINKLTAFKFIVLTLDAPVPGKREHDERAKSVGANLPIRSTVQSSEDAGVVQPSKSGDGDARNSDKTDKQAPEPGKSKGGIGKALFAGTAADLTWHQTLPWLRQHTSLPILLKGVQTHEDAYLALQNSSYISGIIISNHGGRAMDTAPPPVQVLLEIRKFYPEVFGKLEVYVDGGIRRGTDVVKALCLGARGVGVGRAALWGLGAAGVEGVERMFEVLKEEVRTSMGLLGVQNVRQLGMQHVNVKALERNVFDGPSAIRDLASRDRPKL